MKTIKIFSFVSLFAILLSSCAESWLDSEPTGGMLTQDEFDKLPGTIDGQVRGLYSFLYGYGGAHDRFGQKTIDLVSDLTSSDMAIIQAGYGWFENDAQLTANLSTAGKNAYFWSYYYDLIKNCNVVLKRIVETPTLSTDANMKNNYAQALAMRSYAYMGLYSLYVPTEAMAAELTWNLDTVKTFPVYVETSRPDSAQGGAIVPVVQERIITDLKKSISLFEETSHSRSDKLYMDKTLARALLARFYLQIGDNANAFETAEQAITDASSAGNYILPYNELLTNGFNDYTSECWLWGLNTTVDNRGSLASFFGHVCVYTYSYAWVGAYKSVDKGFYDEDIMKLHPKDKRALWFHSPNLKGKLNPYNKFFSPKTDRKLVAQLDSARANDQDSLALVLLDKVQGDAVIDRDWMADMVYFRIEELYLIAAEAAARHNAGIATLDKAKYNLLDLLKQRHSDTDYPAVETAINAMDQTQLLAEIYYNWRIEMWGEGRSLDVMKRWNATFTRGSNHFNLTGQKVTAIDNGMFYIPYGETSTNPNYD